MTLDRSLFDYSDYLEFLNDEYHRRLARNTKYSIRAFSRDLGLRPNAFSDILNLRYGLSSAMAYSIAAKLKLNAEDAAYFVSLVEIKHGRSFATRNAAEVRLKKIRNKSGLFDASKENHPELFSHWYQPAILEMITIFKGQLDEQLIAKTLNITPKQAEDGLKNLMTLGLVSLEKSGLYSRRVDFVAAESPQPKASIRSFHKQILQLAMSAVDEQPITSKKSISTTISFNSKNVGLARNDLDLIHDQFVEKFQTSNEADSIYAVSIQFIRLDKAEKI